MSYKILYIADLHGNKEFYKRLIEKAKENIIRAVVIGGDLCPRRTGTLEQSINYQKEFLENFFIPQLSMIKKDVFFIMGNDDFRINESILNNNNLNYINKNRFKLFNKNIVGYSFVNPTPFRLKDWEKFEDEKQEKQNQFFDYEIRTVKKGRRHYKGRLKQPDRIIEPKKDNLRYSYTPFQHQA